MSQDKSQPRATSPVSPLADQGDEFHLPTKTEVDEYSIMCIDHGADALVVLNAEGQLLWQNRAFERLTGYSMHELLGRSPRDKLISEKSDPKELDRFAALYKAQVPFSTEVEFRSKLGEDVWLEINVTPVFNDVGKLKYFITSSRDTTQRRKLRQQHEQSLEVEKTRKRERRLLSQVSEWLYSAKSLEELTKVVSLSLETLVPEASGQLFIYANSRDVLDLLIGWNGAIDQNHIDPDDCWSLRRGRAYSFGLKSIEFPCQHADKRGLPYFCLPIIAHGQTNGLLHLQFKPETFVGMSNEQKYEFMQQRWQLALLCAEQISLSVANVQLRQELLDQSVRDPLTNLWNRRWLLDAVHKEIQKTRRTDKPFSILSLDIDHFKKFNDHHGHDAGDLVLRALGSSMLEFFGNSAAACRMGGEEFLVLCPDQNSEEAAYLAEQFQRKILDLSVNYDGIVLPKITISIGVASYPKDATELMELLKVADRAMYQAKDNGRDQIKIYTPAAAPRQSTGQLRA